MVRLRFPWRQAADTQPVHRGRRVLVALAILLAIGAAWAVVFVSQQDIPPAVNPRCEAGLGPRLPVTDYDPPRGPGMDQVVRYSASKIISFEVDITAPTSALQQTQSYLKCYGLTVDSVVDASYFGAGYGIESHGPVAHIESAFHIRLYLYRNPEQPADLAAVDHSPNPMPSCSRLDQLKDLIQHGPAPDYCFGAFVYATPDTPTLPSGLASDVFGIRNLNNLPHTGGKL